ncbi:hypothetical protein HK096_000628, partial [Nowakowskiella sp. JEL0078]
MEGLGEKTLQTEMKAEVPMRVRNSASDERFLSVAAGAYEADAAVVLLPLQQFPAEPFAYSLFADVDSWSQQWFFKIGRLVNRKSGLALTVSNKHTPFGSAMVQQHHDNGIDFFKN